MGILIHGSCAFNFSFLPAVGAIGILKECCMRSLHSYFIKSAIRTQKYIIAKNRLDLPSSAKKFFIKWYVNIKKRATFVALSNKLSLFFILDIKINISDLLVQNIICNVTVAYTWFQFEGTN